MLDYLESFLTKNAEPKTGFSLFEWSTQHKLRAQRLEIKKINK